MSVAAMNGALRRVPPWVIYLAGGGWAGWLFWLGATGGLGPEPVNALERAYGDVALKLLVAGLAVTPLRRFAGINLMPFRRAIGVTAFCFVLAHFAVWAVLDLRAFDRVWSDILKRPYVTIGMAGFALLIPLALTSNNAAVRRLGGTAWRRLHKLAYPAAVLGAAHYIWLTKGVPYEGMIYLAVILLLLALRLPWAARFRREKAI